MGKRTWSTRTTVVVFVDIEVSEDDITDEDREWVDDDDPYPLRAAAEAAALRIGREEVLDALQTTRLQVIDYDLPADGTEPETSQEAGEEEEPRYRAPTYLDLLEVAQRWEDPSQGRLYRAGREAITFYDEGSAGYLWRHEEPRNAVASAYYDEDDDGTTPADYRVRGVEPRTIHTLEAFEAALAEVARGRV